MFFEWTPKFEEKKLHTTKIFFPTDLAILNTFYYGRFLTFFQVGLVILGSSSVTELRCSNISEISENRHRAHIADPQAAKACEILYTSMRIHK
jgi:hypothetical protein